MKQKANRLYDVGRYEDAKAFYLQAKKLNNKDPDLYLRLGQVEFKRANVKEAVSLFEQAKKLDPANPESHFLLGAAYVTEGYYRQAIPELEETVHLQPHHVWALEYLGTIYYRTGRMKDAYQRYMTLAELDPEHAYVHTYLGELYFEDGNYTQTKAEFQKAMKANPTYWVNYAWLGLVEARLGSMERAIQYYQRAVELSPEDAMHHLSLGQAYFDQEQYQKALEAFTKSLTLSPEYHSARRYKELAERMISPKKIQGGTVDTAKAASRREDTEAALHAAEQRFEELVDLVGKEAFNARIKESWNNASEVQTKYFIVKTNLPADLKETLLQDVDGLFDDTTQIIDKLLQIPPEKSGKLEKIKLYVFPKLDEYDAYISSMTPYEEFFAGFRGMFLDSRNEIIFLFSPDDDMKEIAHEFTHAYLWRVFHREIPPWLNEGLAEYVLMKIEGDTYFGNHGSWWKRTLESALKRNSLIPLPELIRSATVYRESFYPCAWSFVTFLIDRTPSNSLQGLRAYCQLLREKSYSGEAFWDVFGKSQILEAAWKNFIREIIDEPATRWRITH